MLELKNIGIILYLTIGWQPIKEGKR